MNIFGLQKHLTADCVRFLIIAASLAGMRQSVVAATLYVNPSGAGGAYPTIGAAVAKAHSGDIIDVAPGSYHEDVTIGIPLSLVGAGCGRSIINAIGLPNGIYIDGFHHPGLRKVAVTGFTVENANFEGILVTNASFVTIWDNQVIHNDLVLNSSGCPGQPAFETSEGDDCGEGIHLIGVDNSTVANNTSEKNSGGILLTDETGATHHNQIIGNLVQDNPFDCGITLASHPPLAPLTSPPGVYNNLIANNESFHNGYQVPGAGAGVGIFAPGPGNQAYANVFINNQLRDNGLPGVALHNHAAPMGAPAVNLNNNVIIGNSISGNGADTADAATPGPTGINVFGVTAITGTVISGNVIDDEDVDVAINTLGTVNIHLNDLLGGNIGVDNISSGTVDATENWWGSPAGPGTKRATSVSGPGVSLILFMPWLTSPILQGPPLPQP
jgi:parallel beta-helix repeat protein